MDIPRKDASLLMLATRALRLVFLGIFVACSHDSPIEPSAQGSRKLQVASKVLDQSMPIVGSYIVLMDDSISNVLGIADRMSRQRGARTAAVWSSLLKGFSINGLPSAAIEGLRREPGVRLVEENLLLTTHDVQPLPLDGGSYQYSSQWNLDRVDETGSAIFDGQYSYSYNGSSSHIYIVDTGIRGTHADFAGRIGNGASFVPWWEDTDPYSDVYGHGTSVASVAAGTTYGVAKGATLHSVKVSNSVQIPCDRAVSGMDWVRTNGQKPGVANLSFGGEPNCFSVRDAMERLYTAGYIVVKSAGNADHDAYLDRANRANGAIIVGATDRFDGRAYYTYPQASNWGSTVTLFAPGGNFDFLAASHTGDTAADWFAGTSAAAPMVAGMAAAVYQKYPWSYPAQVYNLVILSASNVPIANGNGSPNRLLSTNIY